MSEKGTEQATEHRKLNAKERGDVPRSRELLSAVAMLSGLWATGSAARGFALGWGEVYARCLQLCTTDLRAISVQSILQMSASTLMPAGLVLSASFGMTLLAGLTQSGGLKITSGAITFKLDRLDPVANFGRIFGLRSVFRLVKSLVPAAIVATLAYKALSVSVFSMPVLSLPRVPKALDACFRLSIEAAWVMVGWSALDYVVELRDWNRRLRMTKQELRDEMKETMGNPQIKGRIRQMQHAMRRRKVKADVSRATVVITNPTHYAVALAFSFESMMAPTVLIKGKNLHALRIREEARWAGIPIIENKPLAQSIYKTVPEGQSIPFELYAAVAGILAFLYRQEVEKAAKERQRTQSDARTQGQGRAVGGN